MKKRILSLCLSAAIVMTVSSMAVNASETSGEGASTAQAVEIEQEQAQEEAVTDAAGNVIAPETAQAIDNADLGVTNITPAEEPAVAEAAVRAEARAATTLLLPALLTIIIPTPCRQTESRIRFMSVSTGRHRNR